MVHGEGIPSMATLHLCLHQYHQREMSFLPSASVDWHQGLVTRKYDWMIHDIAIDQLSWMEKSPELVHRVLRQPAWLVLPISLGLLVALFLLVFNIRIVHSFCH